MKKIILILSIISFSECFSQNNKASDDGFILLGGAGNLSGGLGAIVQYQYRIDLFTFLVLIAGSGVELGTRDIEAALPGYSAGITLENGKYNRVTGGLLYGTRGVGYENKDSEIVNKHVMVGPSLVVGYKALSRSGFVFTINVGMAYVRNPIAINKKYYSSPTAGIAIGYKL